MSEAVEQHVFIEVEVERLDDMDVAAVRIAGGAPPAPVDHHLAARELAVQFDGGLRADEADRQAGVAR